jgi:hypothetical protein
MRSPLPSSAAATRVAAWAALLVTLALAGARSAHALEIAVEPPRERGGRVWTDIVLGDLFGTRVAGSLARGMPATLTLHAELWRRRGGWFDRLESSFDAALRLHYDFRADAYLLERSGAQPLALPTLDSVRTVLSRPLALPVGRVGPLVPGQRYYVLVLATLKPLSVEDAEEVEGWLSGEVEGRRREPFGLVIGLPRSVFDAVRNFAGFGDEHARALTEEFELRDLFGRK